jgi:hypothetical protein
MGNEMQSVSFEIRDRGDPSRWEIIVRFLFLIPLYVMFTISLVILLLFIASNFFLTLLFGKRSRKLTEVTAKSAGYVARAFSYFWGATDERPPLTLLEYAPLTDFRWSYKERAYRRELPWRILLFPVYAFAALVIVLFGTCVVGFLQLLLILLFGKRQRGLASLAEDGARLLCQIYCYVFLVSDERPWFSGSSF